MMLFNCSLQNIEEVLSNAEDKQESSPKENWSTGYELYIQDTEKRKRYIQERRWYDLAHIFLHTDLQ